MTAYQQNFLIPQLNITANNSELKKLQHNMLSDYYQKQLHQRQQKYGISRSTFHQRSQSQAKLPNFSTAPNIQSDYSYLYSPNPQDKMKKELIRSYEEQLQQKQMTKKQMQQRDKLESQMTYQAVRAVAEKDRIRAYANANRFKQEAIEQIKEKQLRKQIQKRMLEQQKKAFQHRYSTNLLSLNKQQSFKQHYNKVQNAQDINKNAYLTNVVPLKNRIERQKQKIVDKGIFQHDQKLRETLMKESLLQKRYRDELRDTLVQQIHNKEEKKKKDTALDRAIKYTSDDYHNKHHPINNPVDFKITHDNKYIIGQLRSRLAKSGSQSLI